ncbi:chromosome condensation complex Condensin, subunit G [Basidiobolus ranarum]|uniref:Chromosome condensation complex Condensin, subunit G n=1 Tax=Basidiobolus ranarum TaxID=34480 RepID=A0ABR2X3X1_9FUNG
MSSNNDIASALAESIPKVFQEVQKTVANHRKLANVLRKLQEKASKIGKRKLDNQYLSGEQSFNLEFTRNLSKILPVKKREPAIDRVIKFVQTFIQYSQEKDKAADNEAQAAEDPEASEETLSSRFVEYLMKYLLKGVNAREKPVRLRVCQLIALTINSLGEIDEDLYNELKSKLLDCARDKEAGVRVQVAIALSRLQDTDDEIGAVTEKLIEMLRNDPSAEVRRAVFYNIELNEALLPYILERARDVDATNRKCIYLRSMIEIGDFRVLSIEDREKLLKWGLSDRDANVKKACSKMLSEHWINQADNNLLEFLERLDVTCSDAAESALSSFFEANPEVCDSFSFNDQFWENLTPESAFLVRVFCDFCKKNNEEKLEATLPNVTQHAVYLQEYSQLMLSTEEGDDAKTELEFIVNQLLLMAGHLDFADEIGRRHMFTLLKETLIYTDVPDKHLPSVIEILKKISVSEKDFTRLIIEIIIDIRESTDEALKEKYEDVSLDEDEEMEKRILEALAILKCLNIAKNMLERSSENLRENSSMYGLLKELIIPSTQSSEDILKETAIRCLGLCCLLDKTLAAENFQVFIHCVLEGHIELQEQALMIIFDLIMLFGIGTLTSKLDDPTILDQLLQECMDCDVAEILAIAIEGVSKLFICKALTNTDEYLPYLVTGYFHPRTADNQRLRQCLSYFLPVFCHSSHKNQQAMTKITPQVICDLIQVHKDLTSDEEMVSPLQIAQQIADWTDSHKLVRSQFPRHEDIDHGIHADLVQKLLEMTEGEAVSSRRTLLQILTKFRVDETAGEERLQKLLDSIEEFKESNPVIDAVSRNALKRLETSVQSAWDTLQEQETKQSEPESSPDEEPASP